MKASEGTWDVYHLVQPYIFSHYHFYKRKILALRAAGISASALIFIDNGFYKSEADRFDPIIKEGLVKCKVVKSKLLLHFALFVFAINEILKGKLLVFHVLRVNSFALIFIKMLPWFGRKIKLIQEFEGDIASEFSYSKEYVEYPRPKEKPERFLNKIKYQLIKIVDHVQASRADAMVLMSKEHVDLWVERLGHEFKFMIFPTLPEPERIHFSCRSREKVRAKLGLANEMVLIYVGNVECKWQRLEGMCKFIYNLYQEIRQIKFLFLVRKEDLLIAKECILINKIEEITILDSLPSNAIFEYMSAADFAVFLRHDHLMNRVVTSGKLGEYLAAGLPVISTGANASVLNEFMLNSGQIIKIEDDLKVVNDVVLRLEERHESSNACLERERLSKLFYDAFESEHMLKKDYPNFISSIISSSR